MATLFKPFHPVCRAIGFCLLSLCPVVAGLLQPMAYAAPAAPSPTIVDKSRTTNGLQEKDSGQLLKTVEAYGKKADRFQAAVSNRISSSADWLDSFFHEDRMEVEENSSSLRVGFFSLFEEGEDYDVKLRARFRLVLPEFEEKFHLFLSSVFEEDDLTGPDSLDGRSGEKYDEKNLNLSFRYFFKAVKRRNISFRVGANFDNMVPEPYAGPRYRVSNTFGPWTIRFTDKLTRFAEEGWKNLSDLDFERNLSDPVFFRTRVSGDWYQEEHGYFYSWQNALYITLGNEQVLGYHLNYYLATHPCHQLSEVLIRIRYRCRVWRKWFFFDIAPQTAYRRINDFDPVPGIYIGLEARFGK